MSRAPTLITITDADLSRRDMSVPRQAYEDATSSSSALLAALGTMRFSFEPKISTPLPWQHPTASSYARFIMADMPLFPVLLAMDSPSLPWMLLSQHGHGVNWPTAKVSPAVIHMGTFGDFMDRSEALMQPSVQRLEMGPKDRATLAAHVGQMQHRLLGILQGDKVPDFSSF